MSADSTAAEKDQAFEEEQAALRASQGLPEGAVPEQRPQAFLTDQDPHNELYKRLEEAGEINQEAMPRSAYEKAASDAQAKKAEKESRPEAGYFAGSFFKVTKGPHEGRVVAFRRVLSYASDTDRLAVATGSQDQNYIVPFEIDAVVRGDERDGEPLTLQPERDGLVRIPGHWSGVARG